MISFINANLGQFSNPDAQSLIVHIMLLTHYVQKEAMDKLLESKRYTKLNLAYEGYISILAEGECSPGEIANRLGITKQACSKTLKELEGMQLIDRHQAAEDARSFKISLSPAGLQLLQDGIDVTNEIHRQFAEEIGSEQLAQLIVILEKLCRHFGLGQVPFRALESSDGHARSPRPPRLNVLLPQLTNYIERSVLTAMEAKGFKGLKPSFGQVLGMINRESRKIQYIASVIGVSKQAIAATASELEQLGYVSRDPDPNDKRQILLSLTPLGKQLLTDSVAEVRALESAMEALLSNSENRLLNDSMAALYSRVVKHYYGPAVLPARLRQLSDSLVAELGVTGAHALGQHLINITRGKQ